MTRNIANLATVADSRITDRAERTRGDESLHSLSGFAV